MNSVQIRRLTEYGIKEFSDYIRSGALTPPPKKLLSDPTASENIGLEGSIDLEYIFANRTEFAEYAISHIGSDWHEGLRPDIGFWTWWALAYFDQFCGAKVSRIENYIFNPAYNLYYRHCAATPIWLVQKYGSSDARLFLTSNMSTMGEMVEQCVSRQYLMRSPKFREVVRQLYFDKGTNSIKKGTTSKPPRKRNKSGKWGQAGKGSIRRFALEIQRLVLTYNLEELQPKEIISLLGIEYQKFTV